MANPPEIAKPDSASRLGLQLQGYDQVVALAQTGINQTLQRHYDNNADLCTVDARAGGVEKPAIRGKIQPPQIELIDVESGGDQAYFCLEFTEGNFTYFAPESPDPTTTKPDPSTDDPDKAPVTNSWKQIKVPLVGWKLALFVSFGRIKMAEIPEEVKKRIDLPGNYSVDQVLVHFGDASLVTFDWAKSVVPGLERTDAVHARVVFLISTWLEKIKTTKGSHNVLGYAVTVPKADADHVTASKGSFPPTDLSLQVVNDQPGGDATKASTSNDFNALVFAEMVGSDGPTRMPTKDLKWSGSFFYAALSGTLILSRNVFWNQYIKKKLSPINASTVRAMNDVVKLICPPELLTGALDQAATDNLDDDKIFFISDKDNLGAGDWSRTDGLTEIFDWQGTKNITVVVDVPDTFDRKYDLTTTTSLSHKLYPMPGKGVIKLETTIHQDAKLVLGLKLSNASMSTFEVTMKLQVGAKTSISFATVDSKGGLGCQLTSEGAQPDVDIIPRRDSASDLVIFRMLPGLNSMYETQNEVGATANRVGHQMADVVTRAAIPIDDIAAALNNQNQFFFPGAGSLEMKDVVFSNMGDLLVGLTWLDK